MGLIRTPKFFLQANGMWPLEVLDGVVAKKLYLAYRWFFILWYAIFNISQSIECIRLLRQGEPFERTSKCISIVVTLVLMLWKAIIYLRNKIPQMCLVVIETEAAVSKSEDKKIQAAYKRIFKNNNYLNIWIVGSSTFTFFAFVSVSFLELSAIGSDFWSYENVSFMHELYLPFEKKDHYLLVIFVNVITAIQSIIFNAAIQTTFFGLIAYVSLRLSVLRIELKNHHVAACNADKILKSLIKEHQDTIRFVEDLNEATKNVLLMSFLLNSIKIAAVLFQIMTVRNLTVLLFPIFYSFFLISEVICLGWMCNEVKEQSLAIAHAIYETLWYNQPQEIKVMLHIMMMRAQIPLTMTIGPFSPMSTDTIVTTLKAGYSYATIMMDR